MITDRDLAALTRGLYAYAGDEPVSFDHIEKGCSDDGIYWGSKAVSGCDVVVFRGSVTVEDWFRDLSALPTFTRLGFVHYGFNCGILDIAERIAAQSRNPIIVCGHSLGAARATICAGYLCALGRRPVARVVWGEPLSGFSKLADILECVTNNRSYIAVNQQTARHDPVTEVPIRFGPFNYVRATTGIVVPVTPAPSDTGLFSLHHIQLYEAATPRTILKGV